MWQIEKRAVNGVGFHRSFFSYNRARDAFRAFLQIAGVTKQMGVLLPAYIGQSPKEGSGVFDPIREINASYSFYRVDRKLNIDIEHLKKQLYEFRPRVVLLIHYFGYPDIKYREVAAIVRNSGAFMVEDEAHAMLSDLVGGVCGREGVASLFSLHKLLPVQSGGILVLNASDMDFKKKLLLGECRKEEFGFYAYDLASIARVRLSNAKLLIEALKPLSAKLDLLRPKLPPGIVPQTLPVIIKNAPRNEVYKLMNEAGFGVVSLYHTMISELPIDLFSDSYLIAERILNLPVHQDTSKEPIAKMVAFLENILTRRD